MPSPTALNTQARRLSRRAFESTREGKYERAIRLYERALLLAPEMVESLNNLGGLVQMLGDTPRAARLYAEAARLRPDLDPVLHNRLAASLYLEEVPAAEIARIHRTWGERFPPVPRPPIRRDGGPLRLAYLSGGLRHGPQYSFLTPLFRSHDRDRFEVYCYSNCAKPDEFTGRARRMVDHWRDISGDDDATAIRRIQNDRIDILIDAAGHFAEGRLRLFAYRPAPVQVSLSQYPATTGLAAIEYRIAGPVADPPGVSDHLYSERLFHLPEGFPHSCFGAPRGLPAPNPLPARRNGYITFGHFNKADKVGPQTIEAWAEVLRRVPRSRLLCHHVFNGAETVEPVFQRTVRRAFAAKGISRSRISFVGYRPLREHFAVFQEVDLLLDTFPYCGMTTTCEALWMGVPVVTLRGEGHQSRVGASLLGAVGLQNFVAASVSNYVELVERHASDLDGLGRLRRELRERMRESPLTDAVRYTRALEAVLGKIWQDALQRAEG